eukprot:359491-Chlamydomonas_euryale.AAC.2
MAWALYPVCSSDQHVTVLLGDTLVLRCIRQWIGDIAWLASEAFICGWFMHGSLFGVSGGPNGFSLQMLTAPAAESVLCRPSSPTVRTPAAPRHAVRPARFRHICGCSLPARSTWRRETAVGRGVGHCAARFGRSSALTLWRCGGVFLMTSLASPRWTYRT